MKLKAWIDILRLWSLTAATVPVLVGSALAWRDEFFSPAIFMLTILSGWSLQSAVNLLNTYGDFLSGVDRDKQCSDSEVLISGALRPGQILAAASVFVLTGVLLGVWAAALSSWKLLLFAVPALIGVLGYTTVTRFKYMGMGVPIVFFLMGVVMVTAAYYAHSERLSPRALLVSLPIAALVAVILHGNDLRDFESDRRAGIRTIALSLGLVRGRQLFCVLHAAAYLVVAACALSGVLPLWSLMVFLIAPRSFQICRCCLTTFRPGASLPDAQLLVAGSAQVHLIFGVLLTIALLLG